MRRWVVALACATAAAAAALPAGAHAAPRADRPRYSTFFTEGQGGLIQVVIDDFGQPGPGNGAVVAPPPTHAAPCNPGDTVIPDRWVPVDAVGSVVLAIRQGGWCETPRDPYVPQDHGFTAARYALLDITQTHGPRILAVDPDKTAVVLANDHQLLVRGTFHGKASLELRTLSGHLVRRIPASTKPVTPLAVGGGYALVAEDERQPSTDDQRVDRLDLRTGKLKRIATVDINASAASFSADHHLAIVYSTVSHFATAQVYGIPSGAKGVQAIAHAAFTADGTKMLVCRQGYAPMPSLIDLTSGVATDVSAPLGNDLVALRRS